MFMNYVIDGIGKNMLYVKYWFGLKFYEHIYFCARNQLSNEFFFVLIFCHFWQKVLSSKDPNVDK